jgi:hypothetical protein
MHELCYGLDDRYGPGYLPRFVDSFRRRHLVLKPPPEAAGEKNASRAADQFSGSAVYAYRGYFAAAAGRAYGALPQESPRPVDPRLEAAGPLLQTASTWEELIAKLEANPLAGDVSPPQIVPDMRWRTSFNWILLHLFWHSRIFAALISSASKTDSTASTAGVAPRTCNGTT